MGVEIRNVELGGCNRLVPYIRERDFSRGEGSTKTLKGIGRGLTATHEKRESIMIHR